MPDDPKEPSVSTDGSDPGANLPPEIFDNSFNPPPATDGSSVEPPSLPPEQVSTDLPEEPTGG